MPRELTKQQLIERSINKKFRKELWTPFVAAVKRYARIQAGDRLYASISGARPQGAGRKSRPGVRHPFLRRSLLTDCVGFRL